MLQKSNFSVIANSVLILLLIAMGLYVAIGKNIDISKLFSQRGKVVSRDLLPRYSPIEIDDLRIGDTAISRSKYFDEKRIDWLKDFSFELKNQTNKKIVFIEVDLDFPETKSSGPEMSYRMNFGYLPRPSKDSKTKNIENSNSSINFTRENDIFVSLIDKYSEIEKFIDSRDSMKNINRLLIRFGVVIFEDGTMWSPSSGWYKPNPEFPEQSLKIDPPEIIYNTKNNSQ